MSSQKKIERAVNFAVEQEILKIPTADDRAQGIAEHWERFSSGEQQGFSAYFIVDDMANEEVRTKFLSIIDASTEIPEPSPLPSMVYRGTEVALEAVTHTYESGAVCGVHYIGQHMAQIAINS